jgi:hypothetical protein
MVAAEEGARGISFAASGCFGISIYHDRRRTAMSTTPGSGRGAPFVKDVKPLQQPERVR